MTVGSGGSRIPLAIRAGNNRVGSGTVTAPAPPQAPTPVILPNLAQGAPGPSGRNGTSIYTGSGVPSALLGQEGDVYIDLDTGDVYNKGFLGWGTPVGTIGGGTGWYLGSGAPGSISGAVDGSLYLDTTGCVVYEMVSSSWVSQCNFTTIIKAAVISTLATAGLTLAGDGSYVIFTASPHLASGIGGFIAD